MKRDNMTLNILGKLEDVLSEYTRRYAGNENKYKRKVACTRLGHVLLQECST